MMDIQQSWRTHNAFMYIFYYPLYLGSFGFEALYGQE